MFCLLQGSRGTWSDGTIELMPVGRGRCGPAKGNRSWLRAAARCGTARPVGRTSMTGTTICRSLRPMRTSGWFGARQAVPATLLRNEPRQRDGQDVFLGQTMIAIRVTMRIGCHLSGIGPPRPPCHTHTGPPGRAARGDSGAPNRMARNTQLGTPAETTAAWHEQSVSYAKNS